MIRSEEIQLPQGTIRYRDLGEGPAIVFVHGYLVDSRLWSDTAEQLSATHRCILPDWPMGAHALPMNADADLSPYGMADLIADFIDALGLEDVTIVANDSGGAISQVLATRRPEKMGRLVLTNCDTYDQFPPGIFKLLPPLMKLPGAQAVAGLPFKSGHCGGPRSRPSRSQDLAGADRQLVCASGRRRDPSRHRQVHGRHEQALHAGGGGEAGELRSPTLIAWGAEDSVFKLENASAWRGRFPTPGWRRSPTRRPSSRSISRRAWQS